MLPIHAMQSWFAMTISLLPMRATEAFDFSKCANYHRPKLIVCNQYKSDGQFTAQWAQEDIEVAVYKTKAEPAMQRGMPGEPLCPGGTPPESVGVKHLTLTKSDGTYLKVPVWAFPDNKY